jgi:prolyl-tRNA synthetase
LFADAELVGIPHRLVISERGLKDGLIEYQARRDTEAQRIPREDLLRFLQERLA